MAAGSELLIVDAAESERLGLRHFFEEKGYVCTAVGTAEEARQLLAKKFFPAALVDLDVERPGAGVELIRYIREKSRHTSVVLLTGGSSFEGAVSAVRAGAIDVVRKVPDQVEYLAMVVARATDLYRATDGGGEVLIEVQAVLDDAFKIMLAMSRKVYAHLSLAAAPLRPRVLVVEGDPDFLMELSKRVQDTVWEISGEMNGGAALDRGASGQIDILAVRAELMDLPGSMVIKSIQAQHPEVLGLLYSDAGDSRVEHFVRGQSDHTERPFSGPAHLIKQIDSMVERLANTAEERRFIQAFSGDNRAFLRRYADLKLKIDRLISD